MKMTHKRGRLRVKKTEEDINPMDGVANIADAMLVFACGLLIALIINWNVDVNTVGEDKTDKKATYEVEDIEGEPSKKVDDESGLKEMGTVYKDPNTGKYYVIEEK